MPTIKSSTEQLTGRLALYGLLQEGLDDIAAGRTQPFPEAMDGLMRKYRTTLLPPYNRT